MNSHFIRKSSQQYYPSQQAKSSATELQHNAQNFTAPTQTFQNMTQKRHGQPEADNWESNPKHVINMILLYSDYSCILEVCSQNRIIQCRYRKPSKLDIR